MRKLAQLTALVLLVTFTTAAAPSIPGASLVHAPLAIIEGGTVRTLPKEVRSRGGRIVVLRGKPAGTPKQEPPKVKATSSAKTTAGDRARSCACGDGGSASGVAELRQTESGLRVVVIGPDGQARTRYVPGRGATARHEQDS